MSCDIAVNECVAELPDVARFVQISGAHRHACGIDAAGALFCWGDNENGRLGVGDSDDRLVPTRVGSDSDWIAISAGENVTCGLRAPDQLFCWGVSDGNDRNLPGLELGSFKAVAAGQDAWCAIATDDTLTCFRRGAPPAPEPITFTPTQISTTRTTVCAIDTTNHLRCWGDNQFDQIGNGDDTVFTADQPFDVGTYQSVELGDVHTCAIDLDGRLQCWGRCQTAIGRDTNCDIPTPVDNRIYQSVSAGTEHTCAISDGEIYCFGLNSAGELGGKAGRATRDPQLLEGFPGWTSVIAGTNFSCGLRADNETWCWGANIRGQLGEGGGGIEQQPVRSSDGPFAKVSVGVHVGCAIGRDGSLWCWGSNSFGQLGDGTTTERTIPTQVGTDTNWDKVSVGRTATCGIRTDGTLWCWGDNTDRQLGLGGGPDLHVPTQVGTATAWTSIALTEHTTCGVLAGELLCWGQARSTVPQSMQQQATQVEGYGDSFAAIATADNSAIQLRQFVPQLEPAENPVTVFDWVAIDRGRAHTCGIDSAGLLKCFGENFGGELGIDGNQSFPSAVAEATGGTWTAVSAGDDATCAIHTDAHLACTGRPELTALGDTDVVNRFTAVGTAQWIAISVGDDEACGIQADGSLNCWGDGTSGARADGRGGQERPTRVTPP